MRTHTLNRYPQRSELARWIFVGAVAGAMSVLVFHQGVIAILHSLGVVPGAPYPLQATRPFGVPVIWSITFWGAVWGALLAALLGRFDGLALVGAATIFGAAFPSLVAVLVVGPLKDRPVSLGVALLVNAAWGLGTGLLLALFGRRNEPA